MFSGLRDQDQDLDGPDGHTLMATPDGHTLMAPTIMPMPVPEIESLWDRWLSVSVLLPVDLLAAIARGPDRARHFARHVHRACYYFSKCGALGDFQISDYIFEGDGGSMTRLKLTLRCLQFYIAEGFADMDTCALANLNVVYVQRSGPDILYLPLLPSCNGSSNEPEPASVTSVIGGEPWGCAHFISSPAVLFDIADISDENADSDNARNFATWVSNHSEYCFSNATFPFIDVDGEQTQLTMDWSRLQYHSAVTSKVAFLDVLYVKEDSADTISVPLPKTKTVPPARDGFMWKWKRPCC